MRNPVGTATPVLSVENCFFPRRDTEEHREHLLSAENCFFPRRTRRGAENTFFDSWSPQEGIHKGCPYRLSAEGREALPQGVPGPKNQERTDSPEKSRIRIGGHGPAQLARRALVSPGRSRCAPTRSATCPTCRLPGRTCNQTVWRHICDHRGVTTKCPDGQASITCGDYRDSTRIRRKCRRWNQG